MKTENILLGLLSLVVVIAFFFNLGAIRGEEKMKREFLEGYRAFAIYETNSVGEVKIKRIEWKKP